MTIIKSNKIRNRKAISAYINSKVYKEIKAYCEWAGIFDTGYFIEDIAAYVFRKDKEWQEHLEQEDIES